MTEVQEKAVEEQIKRILEAVMGPCENVVEYEEGVIIKLMALASVSGIYLSGLGVPARQQFIRTMNESTKRARAANVMKLIDLTK